MTPFRNLTLYQLPADYIARLTVDAIDAAVSALPLRELTGLSMATFGWLPHEHLGGGYTYAHGNRVLIRLGMLKRLLPTPVINQALHDKLASIRAEENRDIGAKERRRLRDEIVTDMIPRAFPVRSSTQAVLDLRTGLLWVDTASGTTAEAVIVMLREALGSFPAQPAHTDHSLRAIFTGWLSGADSPQDPALTIGTHCHLEDPVEGGARIAARHQEMFCEEIGEHLQAGKQCTRLELHLAERITFTLGDNLILRSITFGDAVFEDLEDDPETYQAGRAVMLLAEIGGLVDTITREFAIGEPA